jgi:UDP-glucose 4-epimerase
MTAARDARVRRVVLTSSATVYGEQPHQPISESAPARPPNPYAVSKLASEYYVRAIGAQAGIEIVILRIFNAFGPRQPLPPSHAPVIPQLLKQALAGGSLVIYGDGEQTRDFVFVDDVVSALVASGAANDVDQTVINVGSGRETSINELVRLISQITGRDVQPLHNTTVGGGISRSVADIALARRLLGFAPQVTLRDGLAQLVAAARRG